MARLFTTNGNGLKSIDLSQYPDDAWTFYTGKPVEISQALYNRVAFIYRAVNLVAANVAQIPFALVTDSGEDYDTSTDWQNKVGFMPDPGSLLARIEQALCVWGYAYLFRSRNRAKTIDLRYILPSSVEPKLDGEKGLTGFLRTYDKGQLVLEPEDLLYFWEPDPYVEIGPPQSSRFMAAANAAGLLQALTLHEIEFIKRGGVLPTMLMVKGMPVAAEREKLESYWDKFIKGWFSVAGKIFNAESMDVKTVGQGLEALKDANFTQVNREDIAAAFGVPMTYFLPEGGNRATAVAYQRQFYDTAIIPAFDLLADVFNTQLFDAMGLRMEARPNQLEAYQQDETENAGAYAAYIGAGMKPSIAAQIVGIELPPGVEYDDLDPEEAEDEPAAQEERETPPQADRVNAESATVEAEEVIPPIAELRALTPSALSQLQTWERLAVKAAKAGEAQPLFEVTDSAIPAPIVATITAGLASAADPSQVREVFAGVLAYNGEVTATTGAVKSGEVAALLDAIRLGVEALKGGPGSGNWGHEGRPGERGGSGGGGGLSKIGLSKDMDKNERLNALSDYREGRQAEAEGRTRESSGASATGERQYLPDGRVAYVPTEKQLSKWSELASRTQPTDDEFKAQWAKSHHGKEAGWGMGKREWIVSNLKNSPDYQRGIWQGRVDAARELDYSEERSDKSYNLGYYRGFVEYESNRNGWDQPTKDAFDEKYLGDK